MSRKKKILVIFFVATILIYIVFKLTYNNKIDYLVLGDELSLGITPYKSYNKGYNDYLKIYLNNQNKLKSYNTSFCESDKNIIDLINDIKFGKEVLIKNHKLNISQAIMHSDIITLSIGQNEINNILFSRYNKNQIKNVETIYKEIDVLLKDYLLLLNTIRKITDCKIYVIGYYNPLVNIKQSKIDNIFEYINKKFISLETNKNIYYVDISKIVDKSYYIPNTKNPYPSLEGYNYISNQIICKIEKKC